MHTNELKQEKCRVLNKMSKIVDFFQDNKKVYVIAEISQNHDGSLGQAHAFIDAVATTGADAIKFQTHIAAEESTMSEPFRVKFSYEDATRYDYWKRMEWTKEQWRELVEHANRVGLDFLSSAFSFKAFEWLEEIGCPAWKLGSGEVFNDALLRRMIKTGKPMLISSGMSTFDDIEKQVELINQNGNDCAIFQCTTAYPCPPEQTGLNVIGDLKTRFPDCVVGMSDHSGTIYPSLAAVALGARMIEVHVTMSPYMFGPDVASSVTIEELTQMVKGIRMTEIMLSSKVDKNVLNDDLCRLKQIFTKSVYVKHACKAGAILTEEDIALKKPAEGIESVDYENVIGRELLVDKEKDTPLFWEDLKK